MTRDAFYRGLQGFHNLYFKELRFSQFMDNFLGFVKNNKNVDPYYITDTEFMKLMEEYIQVVKK